MEENSRRAARVILKPCIDGLGRVKALRRFPFKAQRAAFGRRTVKKGQKTDWRRIAGKTDRARGKRKKIFLLHYIADEFRDDVGGVTGLPGTVRAKKAGSMDMRDQRVISTTSAAAWAFARRFDEGGRAMLSPSKDTAGQRRNENLEPRPTRTRAVRSFWRHGNETFWVSARAGICGRRSSPVRARGQRRGAEWTVRLRIFR